MKPFSLAALAALALAPTIALAQQAPPPRGVNPATGAAPGQVVQMPVPPKGEEAKAESALTTTIAAFEAGKPNYDDMEGSIVDAVRGQSDSVVATLKSLGELKTLEYTGYASNGVWKYRGQFSNGQADLMIGFGPAGKIQTLWFKPVAA